MRDWIRLRFHRFSAWLPSLIAGIMLMAAATAGLLLLQQWAEEQLVSRRSAALAVASRAAAALERRIDHSLSITQAADSWLAAGGELRDFMTAASLSGEYAGVMDLRLQPNGNPAAAPHIVREMGSAPLWIALPAKPMHDDMAMYRWLVALQLDSVWQAADMAAILRGYRYELLMVTETSETAHTLLRSPGNAELVAPTTVPLVALDDELLLRLMPVGRWQQDLPVAMIGAVAAFALMTAFVVYQVLRLRQRDSLEALHDPLTGLPNRLLFEERAKLALAQAQREQTNVALLFLDLDGFKAINDHYGHRMGDALLRSLSVELAEHIRQVDTLARIGGDEFVVLLTNLPEPSYAQAVANKLVLCATRPFYVDGHELTVGASIGISLYPDDANDLADLLQLSDEAMYRAKRAGGRRFTQA